MKAVSGFTLLIVLVFLQVFALLSLNSMLQTAMLTKANFDQYQTDQLLRLAQTMLLPLEKQVPYECRVRPLPAASLIQRSLSWWQTHACRKTLQNQVFYYVLEWLGRDQCCVIGRHSIMPVDFYRLSLFVAHHNTEIVVQSTIAQPASEKPVCQTAPHFIVPGRQMYREIK